MNAVYDEEKSAVDVNEMIGCYLDSLLRLTARPLGAARQKPAAPGTHTALPGGTTPGIWHSEVPRRRTGRWDAREKCR